MENRMNGSANKAPVNGTRAVCIAVRERHVQADERHQRLEGVVVERAFELGDDQAPKPAQARLAGFC